jgi:hypothetical protein
MRWGDAFTEAHRPEAAFRERTPWRRRRRGASRTVTMFRGSNAEPKAKAKAKVHRTRTRHSRARACTRCSTAIRNTAQSR